MIFTGNDFIQYSDPYSKVKSRMKEGGKVFIYAYNESALVLKTPYFVLPDGSQYAATAVAASIRGYIGVAEAAADAGSFGWVQIRGYCSDVQCAVANIAGSQGHAIFASGANVVCTDTAFTGLDSQFAVLMEDCGGGASTTANMWLVGDFEITPAATA